MPKKLIKSFKFAHAGTAHVLKTQRNIWIHFFIAWLVIGFAYYINVSLFELGLLVLASFAVIVAEMFNTAIEEMVNVLSPEKRLEAGLAKNVAAGAVLLAALGAIIIGCIVFLPGIL